MWCYKCNQEAIKNSALGKDFYYCRGCKNEIDPWVAPTISSVVDDSESWDGDYLNVCPMGAD